MWYEELIKSLLAKIVKGDKQDAKNFLKLYFEKIYVVFDQLEVFEEFLLVLIDKLFIKFDKENENSIASKTFSESLLGLLLVCTKYHSNEEYDLINADFLEIFETSDFEDLELSTQLNSISDALQRGEKKLITNPSKPYTLEEESLIILFNQLEIATLNDIEYSLALDYKNLLTIFKKEWSSKVIGSFFESCINWLGFDKQFDDFIEAVYQVNYSNLQPQIILLAHETNLVQLISGFKNEIMKLKDIPEYSEKFKSLMSLYFKLNLATYSYSLNPDPTAYYSLKYSCLQATKSLTITQDTFPELKHLLNNLHYIIFNIGLYHPLPEEDLKPVSAEIINFLIQLNHFEHYFQENSIPAGYSLQNALKEGISAYLNNQTKASYTLFLEKFNRAITLARLVPVNDPEWTSYLDRLEFAARGLNIKFLEAIPSGKSMEEQYFCSLILKLMDLYNNNYNNDVIVNKIELLIAVLKTTMLTYCSSRNSKYYPILETTANEALDEFGIDLEDEKEIANLLEELSSILKKMSPPPSLNLYAGGKHTIFDTVKTTEDIAEKHYTSTRRWSI